MRKESVSFSNGRCNRLHDIRKIVSKNIDSRLSKYNLNLVDEPIEKAFEKIFGESLARYNQGKKPCRQIKNYLRHIREQEQEGRNKKKNVRHPEYEYVGQIGSRESLLGIFWNEQTRKVCGNKELYDKLNNIFKEFLQEFQIRYPSLYITGFQIHWDEPNGTPHFHIRFVPVAHNYKKGMDTQCSLTKALTECGFKVTDRRQQMSVTDFRHACMDLIEEIALKYGIERECMGNKNKHIPNGLFQQMMREKEQIMTQIDAEKEKEEELLVKVQKEVSGAKEELENVRTNINNLMLREEQLRKKYEDMLLQPPKEVVIEKVVEVKKEVIVEKEVEKIIEVKKEVVVEVPTELNYKEKYLEFDKSLGNVLDSIAGLDDDTFMKVINALPDKERSMYFPNIDIKKK